MEQQDLPALQAAVARNLVRHRSILDIMSKLDESGAKINRAVARSVTMCGCIRVNAGKQTFNGDLAHSLESVDDHVLGELCDGCRENLETEIGRHLYYLAALGNVLGIDLEEVVRTELRRLAALGLFTLA
ncbi:MAG TPA: DUF1573 domain-containing protein [Firmicutes bacterium]|nr:DUF1573 domain-containing protein [Bacillota bacterium]